MTRSSLYRLLRADYIQALDDEQEAWWGRWARHTRRYRLLYGYGYCAPPMMPVPIHALRSQRILARARALGFRCIVL
jgi:hypothetical protein